MRKMIAIFVIFLMSGLTVSASIGDFFTPDIVKASVYPEKIRVGEVQLTTLEVKDNFGVKSVIAEIETEKGFDTVELTLIAGSKRAGTYEARWVCHDTITKEYTTKVTVTNIFGKTAVAELKWFDPTQSHPAIEVEAGSFQLGNYIFPDTLSVGALTVTGKTILKGETVTEGYFKPKVTLKYFRLDSGGSLDLGTWTFCSLAKKSHQEADNRNNKWCHCSVHKGESHNPSYREYTYKGKTDGWQMTNTETGDWNCDCAAVCIKFE